MPVLLLEKKTADPFKQAFRLTLDISLLNSIIEKATYPLPKISKLFAKSSKYKRDRVQAGSSLDVPAVYQQPGISQQYKDRL